jgi:alkylation response protein AidB-like acyl-CoA dehydrogenase
MTQFETLCAIEPGLAELRASVRDFIYQDREKFGWQPWVDSWLRGWDEGFSARLGASGFLGLTIPQSFGGRGLGHLHRYVVSEELLAHGAPVAAHWVADRQLAPGLLSFGTEQQRQRLLPEIAAGRLYSAIGMSEPGAGSDLAAAQTKAARTDGGWLLRGTKVWTSGAQLSHWIVVLARTGALDPQRRHAGFSQFLVPRDAAGVGISPIALMSGEHHFNEVIFDDVFVPDTDVLGEIGNGWHQVTAELSFERSGPERILSTTPLIMEGVHELAHDGVADDGVAGAIGDLLARLTSLRQLSISVARELAEGGGASNRAALVKDLGTTFEQDSVGIIAELVGVPDHDSPVRELLDTAWLHKPLFTLRGGTNEVLRGVVARGMGLR